MVNFVCGVRTMFENSIVCQCTFVLVDFIHCGCDTPYAYHGWCMPDGAFLSSGVIVNNISCLGVNDLKSSDLGQPPVSPSGWGLVSRFFLYVIFG